MVDFARHTPFSVRVSQIPNRFSLPQDFLATIPKTARPRRRKICLQRQTSLNIFGSNVDSTADLTIHKKCHGARDNGCCLAYLEPPSTNKQSIISWSGHRWLMYRSYRGLSIVLINKTLQSLHRGSTVYWIYKQRRHKSTRYFGRGIRI